MALTAAALLALRGTKRSVKERIARTQDISLETAYAWIRSNSVQLTRAEVLDIIIEETGLSEDQVLERRESSTTPQN